MFNPKKDMVGVAKWSIKNRNGAKRDNAGSVCNSGMGMLFFMYSICLHYFFKGVRGG